MPPSHKRLLKEASELSASPSPHFHAAPVQDNLYDWHFTLAGPPPPSPYSGGIYHGRIVLPPTYPLRPPSFRFLTPTGRFEVNREICLSISGHHEESWQPAWGIRTALIAIRSFMDGDAKGQVGGLDVPEAVRREYAAKSGDWCCEVCGRSNGVILGEWRDECREKGVVVENGDEDGVEDGKVEEEEGQKTEEDQKEDENKEDRAELGSAVRGERETEGEDAGAAADKKPLQEQRQVPATASASTAPSTSTSAAPVPAPAPAPPGPSTTPTPTRTPPAVTQFTTTHSNVSQEGPWLDRAIIGVLIALAVMILRRIANTEE